MSIKKSKNPFGGRMRPRFLSGAKRNLALIHAGFNHLDEGISMYDSELGLIAWNRAFLDLAELPDELVQVGRPISELIEFNAAKGVYGAGKLESLTSDRLTIFSAEERHTYKRIRSDGIVVVIDFYPLPDGGIVITYRDVTEHSRAEAALRESEARYARAISGTSDGIWDWDITANKVFYSPRWAEILGYKWEELEPVPETFMDSIHPDDKDRILNALEMHLAHREVYDIDVRLRRKNGEYLWTRYRGRAVWNERDEAIRMAGSCTDISEYKRAGEALRESEERFRRIFEEGPLGMVILELDGRFIAANDRYCEVTGYSEEELIGRSFIDITHPDDVDKDLNNIATASVDGSRPYQTEKRYIKKTGEIVWVNVTHSSMKDANGKPRYCLSMVEDITEQRIRDAQLRQAQKMEAVGQLTGGVAHDFNNLLAVILGNVELAIAELGSEAPVQPLLHLISQAADRGAKLTQRLLAFSRQQVLAPSILDLNAVTAGMTSLLGRTLGEHIEITCSLGANLWLCLADQSQFEGALLNLALNARDAMPEGGTLTIETANVSLNDEYSAAQAEVEPGEYVMLAVSDTGTGISSEDLGHIFEPFFTTKEVGIGSGLGLSMIFGFVKQSGGHMTVYSEVGQGTTFKIYLPQTSKSPEEVASKDLPDSRFEIHEATILVVEDDTDVRTLVVALLSEMGYKVMEAKSGTAAFELLGQNDHIDLLLTDVVLPDGMNGIDIAAKVRKKRPGTRVLFMSGYPKQAIEDANRLDPSEHFLQKPFRRKDLADKVQHVLSMPAKDEQIE